jgi:hypothetical protein
MALTEENKDEVVRSMQTAVLGAMDKHWPNPNVEERYLGIIQEIRKDFPTYLVTCIPNGAEVLIQFHDGVDTVRFTLGIKNATN